MRLATLGVRPCSKELKLAEDLSMHDALEAERAFAGRRLELDLHQRIDMQPLSTHPRAEQEIDGIRGIARPEHAFASGKRAEL